MAARLSAWRTALRRKPLSTRKVSNISYVTLPVGTPIEEETLPHYEPEHYYPVHIGDVFEARYQVAGKLGYGANSKYTVLKVSTLLPKFPSATNRELKIYEHLAEVKSAHPDPTALRFIRSSGPSWQAPMPCAAANANDHS
ncbi:MAG: hypothetical protein M1818_002491 [Claussenomyces sp. TS43310]|nr:MAG: hypothetical protein M1818_002491 [Claussenomyces sp. TS43310]